MCEGKWTYRGHACVGSFLGVSQRVLMDYETMLEEVGVQGMRCVCRSVCRLIDERVESWSDSERWANGLATWLYALE